MNIENNILRYYLKNAYFINGTAYAGKSTMCALLAQKYGMIHCGENYHAKHADEIAVPDRQPGMCYFQTMESWQAFVSRTPDEYERWIDQVSAEAVGFELAELIALSHTGKKIIVDTNIPVSVLHEISDDRHVAIMLSPPSLSVERFFDRADEDKQFLLRQIRRSDDPEQTMENFRACLARLNSQARYDELAKSGFFTLTRADDGRDTRAETLSALAKHFGLDGPGETAPEK